MVRCVSLLGAIAFLSACAAEEPVAQGPSQPLAQAGANAAPAIAVQPAAVPAPGTTPMVSDTGMGDLGATSTPQGAPAAMAPGVTTPPVAPTATGSAARLPCDVLSIVSNRCHQCHGESPIGGAPMPLVTVEDFHKPSYSDPSRAVYELVQERVHDEARPMPPGSLMPEPDLGVLSAWLQGGAQGGADTTVCDVVPAPVVDQPPSAVPADPNEECFELTVHGGQSATDTSKYSVRDGEHYHCFYYDVPWGAGVEGTRFGGLYDNKAVLHHWLLFTTTRSANGTSQDCTGSHIGDNAQLLAGWAVGGQDMVMPPEAGLELPAPGTHLLVEWHFFNTTGGQVSDGSAIQVCTTPSGSREYTAGMTWLGTEDFNGLAGMPAGVESDFTTTCVPSREGMNGADPIHIFAFWPHMHQLGRNMRSVVNRAGGASDEVFNRPFDFNQQIHYEANVDLFPGDSISSTCTFFNNTAASVAFGPSSVQEMCYQFVFSYPTGALKNGAFGLNGATNNCW